MEGKNMSVQEYFESLQRRTQQIEKVCGLTRIVNTTENHIGRAQEALDKAEGGHQYDVVRSNLYAAMDHIYLYLAGVAQCITDLEVNISATGAGLCGEGAYTMFQQLTQLEEHAAAVLSLEEQLIAATQESLNFQRSVADGYATTPHWHKEGEDDMEQFSVYFANARAAVGQAMQTAIPGNMVTGDTTIGQYLNSGNGRYNSIIRIVEKLG